ncbi:protein O-mannosyl-transferase Tmtc3 [Caerostris extrusa]|uniref:Protein O-mannosyl-transferase Tmtc3 n=1 Tax=Caerostris extrusa TaxID=172846 RepID=A0AAV4QH77_CAEEX|nr:protein O-mannosyl-transferase Tmtc3 [Caerostris extrusa]
MVQQDISEHVFLWRNFPPLIKTCQGNILQINSPFQHHPSHINGLILLADINVNHLKNLDVAEECYRKVLKIDPVNQKALHNLCVLHFERQDFATAERCCPTPCPSPHSTLHPAAPAGGQEHPEARLRRHCLQPHGRIIPSCQLTNPYGFFSRELSMSEVTSCLPQNSSSSSRNS